MNFKNIIKAIDAQAKTVGKFHNKMRDAIETEARRLLLSPRGQDIIADDGSDGIVRGIAFSKEQRFSPGQWADSNLLTGIGLDEDGGIVFSSERGGEIFFDTKLWELHHSDMTPIAEILLQVDADMV